MIFSFFKENKTVLLTSLLAAILFPVVVLTPSDYGFIPKDVGLQLVGYFGSILGGFLTLYGVWWTIKEQDRIRIEENDKRNEERIKELAVQYKPLVEVNTECSIMQLRNGIINLDLIIKNIGRGELINGMITSCKPFSNNPINCSYTNKNVFIPIESVEVFNMQLSGDLTKEEIIKIMIKFDYNDLYKFDRFVNIIIEIHLKNAMQVFTTCEHVNI